METKKCKKCHITKPVDEFHDQLDTPDRRALGCKECVRAYYLIWKEDKKTKPIVPRKKKTEELTKEQIEFRKNILKNTCYHDSRKKEKHGCYNSKNQR